MQDQFPGKIPYRHFNQAAWAQLAEVNDDVIDSRVWPDPGQIQVFVRLQDHGEYLAVNLLAAVPLRDHGLDLIIPSIHQAAALIPAVPGKRGSPRAEGLRRRRNSNVEGLAGKIHASGEVSQAIRRSPDQ